jgi:hypothetical protein
VAKDKKAINEKKILVRPMEDFWERSMFPLKETNLLKGALGFSPVLNVLLLLLQSLFV